LKPTADDKSDNEIVIKKIIPIIQKMLTNAPAWGDVNIKLIFKEKKLTRIETATNTSIQVANG